MHLPAALPVSGQPPVKTTANQSSKFRPALVPTTPRTIQHQTLYTKVYVVVATGIWVGVGTHQLKNWWMPSKQVIPAKMQPSSSAVSPMACMVKYCPISPPFLVSTGTRKYIRNQASKHLPATVRVVGLTSVYCAL